MIAVLGLVYGLLILGLGAVVGATVAAVLIWRRLPPVTLLDTVFITALTVFAGATLVVVALAMALTLWDGSFEVGTLFASAIAGGLLVGLPASIAAAGGAAASYGLYRLRGRSRDAGAPEDW